MVLAVLVVLGALAFPAMDRPMATQTLRSGVDDVRTAWVQARLAAMKTGQTYVFRYAPGGRHYVVECELTPEMAVDEDVAGYGSTGGTVQDPTNRYTQDAQLSEHLRFDRGNSAVDTRAQAAAESAAATGATVADPELTWADAIFFYPDGTTSTAVVRVENRFGRMIELSLRGLTGVTTVGPLQDAPADASMGN
jgi:Tfp pilus assembly protein FimT